MIFNPVIIGAIVVQSFISKASKIAGAIAGFVITTGIMLWGISLYSNVVMDFKSRSSAFPCLNHFSSQPAWYGMALISGRSMLQKRGRVKVLPSKK